MNKPLVQNKIIRNIPNFITILNLFAGSLAVLWSFDDLKISAILIFIAAILDFFDGFAARLLRAYSNFGKELDSLADIISFGLAPAMIMHSLLKMSIISNDSTFSFETASLVQLIIILSPFLLVVFSAIRLAKFNLDERQNNSFTGLPTPASGIMIAAISFTFLTTEVPQLRNFILTTPLLLLLIMLLSFLMLSKIPMFSLKFKNLTYTENKLRYLFLFISLILILLLKLQAMTLIIVVYIILSLANNWLIKFK